MLVIGSFLEFAANRVDFVALSNQLRAFFELIITKPSILLNGIFWVFPKYRVRMQQLFF